MRRRGRVRVLLVAAAYAIVGTGCAPPEAAAPWSPPSREELAEARAWLAAFERDLGPRTEEIAITLEAPLLPGAVRARGAIAVEPGRAARVVLLGPGGTTAADLWMDRERHRLAIPAREEVVRGRRGEALRGVPLELFRSWFLEPLEGELLDASIDAGVLHAVIRGGDATLFVRARRDGDLRIERAPLAVGSGERDVEVIHAERGTACGRVTYERPRLGVRAEIVCASRRSGAAERALADPDEEAR